MVPINLAVPQLAIDRIKAIHQRIPNTHLVMHGSSSVSQELLATIRQYGGNIKETYGVPVSEIIEGIKNGVRKVNIDTDIRLAMTAALRKKMAESPDEFDPRVLFTVAIAEAQKVCKNRFEARSRQSNKSDFNGCDGSQIC